MGSEKNGRNLFQPIDQIENSIKIGEIDGNKLNYEID